METPDEWPLEIQELYDPIRILGTGGFASVVLAREKKTMAENPDSGSSNNNNNNKNKPKKVAIKVVGGIHDVGNDLTLAEITQQRDQAVLYARREIEILKHVHHRNIVRLYHHWIVNSEDENESASKTNNIQKCDLTAAVLVLEYAKGPTVDSLLKHGGALSTTFGRVVIAQTMDAIAYLHCHAVLHRDIKPDNILVTGALSSDDFIWDNEKDSDDDESLIGNDNNRPDPNWAALRSKYKVTLIDFGFGRALTPNDVATPSHEVSRKDSELASYHRMTLDSSYSERRGSVNDELGSSERSTRSSRIRRRISKGILDSSIHRLINRRNNSQTDELAKSISHKMKRTMSALGNKNFAAPEIINEVRPQFQPRREPKIKVSEQATENPTPTTETISNYVADYGLLVDSYSMGHTIRYMMTGVQPGISVEDAIQQQSGGCIGKLFSLCFGNGNTKSADGKQKRSVRYRSMEDLPGGIYRLVGALTQISEKDRISIRKARWYVPWIADVLDSENTQSREIDDENKNEQKEAPLPPPASDEPTPSHSTFTRISYLPFATTASQVDASGKTIDIEPTESALSF